jgi:hypothetical protein
LSIRAEIIERGGPEFWEAFMAELRVIHLGAEREAGARDVLRELTEAYLEVKARMETG